MNYDKHGKTYPEPGDYTWAAGYLAAEPREVRYPEDDGLYETVIYMTVAVNHARWDTKYIEVEARGMQRLYLENRIASPVRPLHKGIFVVAGGTLILHRKRPTISLRVFSDDTSYRFDAIDSKPKVAEQ